MNKSKIKNQKIIKYKKLQNTPKNNKKINKI